MPKGLSIHPANPAWENLRRACRQAAHLLLLLFGRKEPSPAQLEAAAGELEALAHACRRRAQEAELPRPSWSVAAQVSVRA